MAIVKNFNNRQFIEPDVAARVLGGGAGQAAALSFGNVCLIDTGSGAGFGGGSGFNGELKSGKDTIFFTTDVDEAKSYLKGGILWDLMDYLFSPSNSGNGINGIYLIKAAETEAAKATLSFDAADIVIAARTEGLYGNGTLNGSNVEKGFAYKVVAGTLDTSKYSVVLYEGSFKGLDADSDSYNGISQTDSKPRIMTSPEFSTTAQVLDWVKNDAAFNTTFKFVSTSGAGGAIINGDIAANPLTAFAGGTEDYASSNLDDVLEAIGELDNTFFICDNYGDDADSTKNNKIVTHVLSASDFEKYVVIGGSTYPDELSAAITKAATFNTSRVIMPCSGMNVRKIVGAGVKEKPSIYWAASVLGRICGLEPQVPATFKDIKMLSPTHNMTKNQRNLAIQAGLIVPRYVNQLGWVIDMAVNTLQLNNGQLINPDGQSFDVGLERIKAQLDRELKIASMLKFIGLNANTASPAEIKAFVEGYLRSKIATPSVDNLIISYKDVKVTLTGDTFRVTYKYVPNSPINTGFITGYAFDVELAA